MVWPFDGSLIKEEELQDVCLNCITVTDVIHLHILFEDSIHI